MAIVQLWKGTVFESKVPSTHADVKNIEKWLEREFANHASLKSVDEVAYVQAMEVRLIIDYIFTCINF
jgi:hypothetical protein